MSKQTADLYGTRRSNTEGMPSRIEDLDPAWLQALLEKSGLDVRIESLDITQVGTGLMGSTYRIRWADRGAGGHVPTSLVFKMTGDGPVSRRLGKRGYGLEGKPGFYGAEVRFYAEIAPLLAIRTPRLHACWLSDEEDEFALLLEDIDDATPGDELKGCGFEEARQAMANLAGLHAPFWNNSQFDRPGWLQRPRSDWAEMFQDNMNRALTRFRENHIASFGKDVGEIVEKFVPRYARWFHAEGQNISLTHNDFRLDNMMFKPDGSSVALDWQSFTTAHSGRDIGLFLGCSVPTELRRKHEQNLLEAYHQRMHMLGITGYSLDECYRDFRLGLFLGVQNVVIGMSAVNMTDRGVRMFRHKMEQCCEAIRDHDALEVLDDI